MTRFFVFLSMLIVFASPAYAGTCKIIGEKDYAPVFRNCPADVMKHAERYQGCTHFADEDPGDDGERAREVHEEMKKLKCDIFDEEKAAIAEKYKKDASVKEVLKIIYKKYAGY